MKMGGEAEMNIPFPGLPSLKALPILDRARDAQFDFRGVIGKRIRASQQNWLLTAPDANPMMLQMFRDRDRHPVRDLVPWAGEFAGKYLISAVQGYRLTRDQRLQEHVDRFVWELIDTQAEDGYLGAFPRSYRLTGRTIKSNSEEGFTWDAWNHYHVMLGLLLWHEETGDEAALAACRKVAPIHVFCLLYERTGAARYLQLAREIERDFETPPAGDYVRTALQGLEFFEMPKPRWESLHDIQGIAELYFITGEDRYRRAFEHIWRSIVRTDRHNTGGFSSGETATGNPYDPRPIETCCTVAWVALSIDMLRMTGLSTVADEIELSTFNGILGAQSPTGRWWTYNTPMDGVRKASAHDIVFQARPGSPELNCCSVNGPRGLGMLSEWAAMQAPSHDAIAINYYGPSTFEVKLHSSSYLRLIQETDYPLGRDVLLRTELEHPEEFCLLLRIPGWSKQTGVALNGEEMDEVEPGSYLSLQRRWEGGDIIQLSFDMSLRLWVGEREAEGKASIYRGPILLAYDQRLNTMDPDDLPALDVDNLRGEQVRPRGPLAPALLIKFVGEGRELFLCDFASAGVAGNPYVSWLPIL
jgi:DUF1680 family protein